MNNADPTPEIKEIKNIDLKKSSELIESLYGFTVNMINYINAHNVTLSEGGNVNPQVKDKIGLVHSKPYNIITLKDEEKYVGDYEENGRKLDCRIYVRGHPRRLKNDQGIIYRTTWVSPHIRGPEGAPWREQRYQVLADKLKREQKINDDFDSRNRSLLNMQKSYLLQLVSQRRPTPT